jgi:hypothetical protein
MSATTLHFDKMRHGLIMISRLSDRVRIETNFGPSGYVTHVFEKQRVNDFDSFICIALRRHDHDEEQQARDWHATLFEMILSERRAHD